MKKHLMLVCIVVLSLLVTATNRVEGVRHFVAILDRVPATAYRPFRLAPNGRDKTPNPDYLGMRRVHLAWLD